MFTKRLVFGLMVFACSMVVWADDLLDLIVDPEAVVIYTEDGIPYGLEDCLTFLQQQVSVMGMDDTKAKQLGQAVVAEDADVSVARKKCHELARILIQKAQKHDMVRGYVEHQNAVDEARSISFQYKSIGYENTPFPAEVESLLSTSPKPFDYSPIGWTDLQSSLIASLDTAKVQYNQDFAGVLTDEDHPYWDVIEELESVGIVPPPPPVLGEEQIILVDLSDQRLYAYQDDYVILTTLITSGRNKFPTHPGEYSVLGKARRTWLQSPFRDEYYRLWVDYWIRISHSGYGIHDTCNAINCWRTEYGRDDYGVTGSHGCINTPYDKVAEIYAWVREGTKVIIQE